MDNSQMPPMQPVDNMPPVNNVPPMAQYQTGPNGMPMVQQVQVMPEQKKDISGLIKTIVIIVVSLIAVTFIGLFIWMTTERNEAQSEVDEKINEAVIKAKDEQSTKMEAEFLEREKYPYYNFSGPEDYGHLTFEYPKTWSVYVEQAANTGGDFKAYLNPRKVNTASKDTLTALRVTIRNKSFEEVAAEYQKAMDKKDSNLTMEATKIGVDEVNANRYTGTIPDTEFSGYIVIFKIRDKTVILQTDSVKFKDEYDKLLGTVVFDR